ncbi:MAG: PDZ domain-containing protein [Vicinamibacterales bacterium]|jgi:hypothetical protein
MLSSARIITLSTLVIVASTPTNASQTASAPEPSVVSAKFDMEGLSQFLVPVRVNDVSFWCSLDSGGSWVLSIDRVKALNAGLRPNRTGSSAGVGTEVVRDDRVDGVTVALGSVILHDRTIVLRPFPAITPDMDCVMGLALLQDYVVEFDYLGARLRIFDAKSFRPSSKAAPVRFNIDRFRNPYLETRLSLGKADEIRANLMLDTGASYYSAVLMHSFIAGNNILNRLGRVVQEVSHTPNLALAATRLARMAVGPFEVAEPVSALIQTPSVGIIHDGLVGAGFFRRFTATFDYTRQQLWLESNGRLAERQQFDASGVEFRHAENDAFAVLAIAPDSPGAMAGLEAGDVLLEIDGRSATGMALAEIKARLSRPGTTCVLRINRKGAMRTATLQLKDRL